MSGTSDHVRIDRARDCVARRCVLIARIFETVCLRGHGQSSPSDLRERRRKEKSWSVSRTGAIRDSSYPERRSATEKLRITRSGNSAGSGSQHNLPFEFWNASCKLALRPGLDAARTSHLRPSGHLRSPSLLPKRTAPSVYWLRVHRSTQMLRTSVPRSAAGFDRIHERIKPLERFSGKEVS